MSANIQGIQLDLRAAKLDGWLFYDFRGRDPIAQHILNLPAGMRTRRWYYFVPAKGTPKKLVHKIESESLAALPGETLYYARQDELRKTWLSYNDPSWVPKRHALGTEANSAVNAMVAVLGAVAKTATTSS